jgi:hypothetical protein
MNDDLKKEYSNAIRAADESNAIFRIATQFSQDLSIEEKKRSALLTCKLHNALRKRTRQIGDFKYKVAFGSIHYEAPINVVILDKKNTIIASFGFYLLHRKGKTNLVINNIQGKRNRKEQLDALSKQVGENWRIWAVKRIKRIAKINGINTSGSLPALHALLQPSSPGEYKRQLIQYKQTFRKAGITEVLNHNVKPYPQKWKEAFKRVKQERRK